jgi:predicted Fe-Mo cluster-binding NifX family protein
MKVCFPVAEDQGMNSKVFNHFNSSPYFLIIDTDTEQVETVQNCDPKDEMKGCNPSTALMGRAIDAIVVGGIGDALLQFLNMTGYQVYETTDDNLRKNIEMLKNQELNEIFPFFSQNEGKCGGEDDSEGACDHDHDHHEHGFDGGHDMDQCVLHGGAGCENHAKGECEGH